MRIKMSIQLAERQVNVLVGQGLVTSSLFPTWPLPKSGNYFTLPDELFYLNLGHVPITVYAYLLCCEDHRMHQCHPSYKTIAYATGPSINTVMKHIAILADKRLITMEHTSYMDNKGMKWAGNNCYTILPIRQAADAFYQQEINRLKENVERQRIAKLLQELNSPT